MNQRRHKSAAPAPVESDKDMRLNRFLARAGIASRREADTYITAGRVQINGETVTELGTRVADGDNVTVDGRSIHPVGAEYFLLNKPKDTVTTKSDEKGRRTVLDVMDLSEKEVAGLFPVGRLDRDTTGALLLTTDGDLAHRLMHPRYTIDKIYVVDTVEKVTAEQLKQLEEGVELEDGLAKAAEIAFIDESRQRIGVKLHEGRNRQLRRMFEAIGHEVKTLERVAFADITLENLRRGRWRRLTPAEINRLRRLVKLKTIVF